MVPKYIGAPSEVIRDASCEVIQCIYLDQLQHVLPESGTPGIDAPTWKHNILNEVVQRRKVRCVWCYSCLCDKPEPQCEDCEKARLSKCREKFRSMPADDDVHLAPLRQALLACRLPKESIAGGRVKHGERHNALHHLVEVMCSEEAVFEGKIHVLNSGFGLYVTIMEWMYVNICEEAPAVKVTRLYDCLLNILSNVTRFYTFLLKLKESQLLPKARNIEWEIDDLAHKYHSLRRRFPRDLTRHSSNLSSDMRLVVWDTIRFLCRCDEVVPRKPPSKLGLWLKVTLEKVYEDAFDRLVIPGVVSAMVHLRPDIHITAHLPLRASPSAVPDGCEPPREVHRLAVELKPTGEICRAAVTLPAPSNSPAPSIGGASTATGTNARNGTRPSRRWSRRRVEESQRQERRQGRPNQRSTSSASDSGSDRVAGGGPSGNVGACGEGGGRSSRRKQGGGGVDGGRDTRVVGVGVEGRMRDGSSNGLLLRHLHDESHSLNDGAGGADGDDDYGGRRSPVLSKSAQVRELRSNAIAPSPPVSPTSSSSPSPTSGTSSSSWSSMCCTVDDMAFSITDHFEKFKLPPHLVALQPHSSRHPSHSRRSKHFHSLEAVHRQPDLSSLAHTLQPLSSLSGQNMTPTGSPCSIPFTCRAPSTSLPESVRVALDREPLMVLKAKATAGLWSEVYKRTGAFFQLNDLTGVTFTTDVTCEVTVVAKHKPRSPVTETNTDPRVSLAPSTHNFTQFHPSPEYWRSKSAWLCQRLSEHLNQGEGVSGATKDIIWSDRHTYLRMGAGFSLLGTLGLFETATVKVESLKVREGEEYRVSPVSTHCIGVDAMVAQKGEVIVTKEGAEEQFRAMALKFGPVERVSVGTGIPGVPRNLREEGGEHMLTSTQSLFFAPTTIEFRYPSSARRALKTETFNIYWPEHHVISAHQWLSPSNGTHPTHSNTQQSTCGLGSHPSTLSPSSPHSPVISSSPRIALGRFKLSRWERPTDGGVGESPLLTDDIVIVDEKTRKSLMANADTKRVGFKEIEEVKHNQAAHLHRIKFPSSSSVLGALQYLVTDIADEESHPSHSTRTPEHHPPQLSRTPEQRLPEPEKHDQSGVRIKGKRSQKREGGESNKSHANEDRHETGSPTRSQRGTAVSSQHSRDAKRSQAPHSSLGPRRRTVSSGSSDDDGRHQPHSHTHSHRHRHKRKDPDEESNVSSSSSSLVVPSTPVSFTSVRSREVLQGYWAHWDPKISIRISDLLCTVPSIKDLGGRLNVEPQEITVADNLRYLVYRDHILESYERIMWSLSNKCPFYQPTNLSARFQSQTRTRWASFGDITDARVYEDTYAKERFLEGFEDRLRWMKKEIADLFSEVELYFGDAQFAWLVAHRRTAVVHMCKRWSCMFRFNERRQSLRIAGLPSLRKAVAMIIRRHVSNAVSQFGHVTISPLTASQMEQLTSLTETSGAFNLKPERTNRALLMELLRRQLLRRFCAVLHVDTHCGAITVEAPKSQLFGATVYCLHWITPDEEEKWSIIETVFPQETFIERHEAPNCDLNCSESRSNEPTWYDLRMGDPDVRNELYVDDVSPSPEASAQTMPNGAVRRRYREPAEQFTGLPLSWLRLACRVCFELWANLPTGQRITLMNCGCTYCFTCFHSFLSSKLNSEVRVPFPVGCAFCDTPIDVRDVLLVDSMWIAGDESESIGSVKKANTKQYIQPLARLMVKGSVEFELSLRDMYDQKSLKMKALTMMRKTEKDKAKRKEIKSVLKDLRLPENTLAVPSPMLRCPEKTCDGFLILPTEDALEIPVSLPENLQGSPPSPMEDKLLRFQLESDNQSPITVVCRTCYRRFCRWCLKLGSSDDIRGWISHHFVCKNFQGRSAAGGQRDSRCSLPAVDDTVVVPDQLGEEIASLYNKRILNYCPKCLTAYMKEEGCNMLTCQYCNVLFCGNCNANITNDKSRHFEAGRCGYRLVDLDVSSVLGEAGADTFQKRVRQGEEVEAVLKDYHTTASKILAGTFFSAPSHTDDTLNRSTRGLFSGVRGWAHPQQGWSAADIDLSNWGHNGVPSRTPTSRGFNHRRKVDQRRDIPQGGADAWADCQDEDGSTSHPQESLTGWRAHLAPFVMTFHKTEDQEVLKQKRKQGSPTTMSVGELLLQR
eukprot:GHVN01051430.1.p1 GENE.GHVN01051430.1~~GHVN01051430.1.p1  ORF type:complete len:2130 (+),score=370.74 GHVN01051430.1:103-6492(+)